MTTTATPTLRRQTPAPAHGAKPALLADADDWSVREVLVLLFAVVAARVFRPTFTLGWVACTLAGIGGHWLLTAFHLLGP